MFNHFLKIAFISFLVILINPKAFSASLFPESHFGVWEGKMFAMQDGQISGSADVRLTVAPTNEQNTWVWKTEYIDGNNQVTTKDYRLKSYDRDSNRFFMDEGDNLILYEHLFGQKLYSIFETSTGTLLTSTTELLEDKIILEITSGSKQRQLHNYVTNFSVRNVQRTVLTRVLD